MIYIAYIRYLNSPLQSELTQRDIESDHNVGQKYFYMPLRRYHKCPHQVVSSSCPHHLYILQCDKDFITALQVEDPTQETVPHVFNTGSLCTWRFGGPAAVTLKHVTKQSFNIMKTALISTCLLIHRSKATNMLHSYKHLLAHVQRQRKEVGRSTLTNLFDLIRPIDWS